MFPRNLGGLSWCLLPPLRAATSPSSTDTPFPRRRQAGAGGAVLYLSVLSQGDGFRVSQGPALVLVAGPRFNALPFSPRTFIMNKPYRVGRTARCGAEGRAFRRREQHAQRCDSWTERASSTAIIYSRVAGGRARREQLKVPLGDWLRLGRRPGGRVGFNLWRAGEMLMDFEQEQLPREPKT